MEQKRVNYILGLAEFTDFQGISEIVQSQTSQLWINPNFNAIKEYDFHLLIADIRYLQELPLLIQDQIVEKSIPIILLQSSLHEKEEWEHSDPRKFNSSLTSLVYESIYFKNVNSYFVKALRKSITRLSENPYIHCLVVEDSSSIRKLIIRHLRSQHYQVHEAKNGLEALQKIKDFPEMKLMITDYIMPDMDGFGLITQIRETLDAEKLAIIGISSSSDQNLSANFLKAGANDFLYKPFIPEEFLCRIRLNLDYLKQIETIRLSAYKDFLTGLPNRRFLYDTATPLIANSKRNEIKLSAAMIDIDFFKKVNDTHGHDAGDFVLQEVGSVLKNFARSSDIVARLGGEEFAMLLCNKDLPENTQFLERLRTKIQGLQLVFNNKKIPVTVSIGYSHNQDFQTLDDILSNADKLLYHAKESGRNCVKTDSETS